MEEIFPLFRIIGIDDFADEIFSLSLSLSTVGIFQGDLIAGIDAYIVRG